MGASAPSPPPCKFIAPIKDCSASTMTGDFLGKGGGNTQTVRATDIGRIVQLSLAPPVSLDFDSPQNHAIFEVAIPLVVTGASQMVSTP